ncbi:TolC family protein [Hyphococcus sp.]|uniref:TolC family protein n=1 Tax=Hyphococcus sp. TaxID=2038636 RepID=UPI00207EAB1A|nr:MAG: hypothetical protein DHS20C04_12470 [Marinicaulis sp.]
MIVRFCVLSFTGLSALVLAAVTEPAMAREREDKGSVYDAYNNEEQTDAQMDDVGSVAGSIRAALSHNPQIRMAVAQKDAAKAERFRALGNFLPEIEANATYANDKWRSDSFQGLTDGNETTVGVTAIQPVFQGLSAINKYRAARTRVSQSDLSLLAVMQQTGLEAARAHAGVILARSIVDHRIENMSLVSQQLTVSEKRSKAGAQSRTGVEQARMRLAQAQVDLGLARTTLAQQEAAYHRIVGVAPPILLLPDTQDLAGAFSSAEDAISVAHNNNPAIGAADAAAAAAKLDKKAALGVFAPQLTLEGSYYKNYGEDPLLPTQDDEEFQILARMRVPIFKQGSNIAGVKSANASVAQQEAQVTMAILAVDEVVQRSWRQLAEATSRAIAAKSGIEAARQSVKGLQMEYEAGQRSVIDVLDGQRDLVIAQINASQAEYELRVSQYELAAATGTILGAYEIGAE